MQTKEHRGEVHQPQPSTTGNVQEFADCYCRKVTP
jgi:hypothetical protein